MNNNIHDELFSSVVPLEEDTEELFDLGGYQVTKAELFAHTREPAITIWHNKIKFNMACLRRFPGVKYIQVLIHPEQKRLIIRPSNADAPDSLRWAKGEKNEMANRDLLCKIFAAKIFDLMNWDVQYRYKMMGKPATCNGEMLFLFKLTDFELFANNKGKKNAYLPLEWRDYFGVPVEEHDESYKIDLADGYITTDKA